MWRRGYLFRFVILKFIVKKCYFVLKKVLFDWRKLFLMSPFMRLFCCWFSFFLARGCFCSCGREGCAMSYLIWGCFFIHLMTFFQWFDEIQSQFFFPVVFLWDFLSCFFKKRKVFFLLISKKGFCWMNWIVCRLSCRRIFFFSDSNFFFNGIKENFIVWKKFFYVSFFHSS